MAKYTGYTLEVNYKLRARSQRQAQRPLPVEVGLVESLVSFLGEPSAFDYSAGRRKITWVLRNSRQARAAEKSIKSLKMSHRRMDIKTRVRYLSQDVEENLEEAKKYLITPGQYKALMREGAARTCLECHQCIPKYKGRYPKNCTGCGGNVGNPIEDAVESILVGKPVASVTEKLVSRMVQGATLGTALGSEIGGDKYYYRDGSERATGRRLGGIKGALTGAAAGAAYHAYKNRKKKKEKRSK